MSRMSSRPFLRWSTLGLVGCSIGAGLLLQFVFTNAGQAWTQEDGPVETASILIWGVALLAALFSTFRTPSLGLLAGATMLLWAALRELDLQKAFSYRSIESLGFYTRSVASVWEKLAAMAAFLPFAAAGLYLVALLWLECRSRHWTQTPWTGLVLNASVLIALALGSEKLFGFTAMEEICELGLACVGVQMSWQGGSDALSRKRKATA